MKDILITVISILLTVVIIICMVKGLTVGSFRILSISNIKQESLNLDNEVDELNNLKNVTYKKKIDDLQTATKDLTTAKQKIFRFSECKFRWRNTRSKSWTDICNGILME